ncbi:hypothetical protein OEZ85_011078 [Tetradesmus obliquus]|uniref:Uncharacterized protein n=1 Tax=Tetradesmus obliquus TaxID=3088 RepID=A0ABY8TR99_TETOB|nr:hypothetical protein OEZ85_011078 [Tetradesmus obliquus]
MSSTTIKCSLRSCINLDNESKHTLLGRIERLVLNVSKLMRRGSLMALLHYTRLLEGGAQPADLSMWNDTGWRQAMTIGVPGFRTKAASDPAFQTTYEVHGHLFPPDADMASVPYTQNVITFAARRLRTAFANNLWVPLMPRLKRLCKAWLADHNSQKQAAKKERLLGPVLRHAQELLDEDEVSALQLLRAIEVGTVNCIPGAAAAFVAGVRSQLGLSGSKTLTEAYSKAKANQTRMLCFLSWLQQQMSSYSKKGVRLCPIFGVRRQHVHLDRTALLQLLNSLELVPEKFMAEQTPWEEVTEWLAGVFIPPRTTSHGKPWSGFLSTDGVAASFVYGGGGEDPTSEEPSQQQQQQQAVSHRHPGEQQQLPAPEDAVVVGIDPGRCTIVHAATRIGPDVLEWTLPRKRYYLEAGLLQAQARERRWDKELIAGAWKLVNQDGGALRSTRVADVISYITSCNRVAAEWWGSALQRKRGKLRFRTYCGRKRCLDRFFQQLAADVEQKAPDKRLVVAYALCIRYLFIETQMLGRSMPAQFRARRRQLRAARNHQAS